MKTAPCGYTREKDFFRRNHQGLAKNNSDWQTDRSLHSMISLVRDDAKLRTKTAN